MQEVWDKTLYSIREQLDAHQYNSWFKPIVCEEVTEDTIVLKVPDRFFRDWLRDNYIGLLRTELSQLTEKDLFIRFTYEGETGDGMRRAQRLPPQSSPFERRYTFDSFVVGPSNQLAHAAASAVADAPGKDYNPLFIYGGVGLGKTHLLHAIANQVLLHDPKATVQYYTSEDFINDLVTSIRNDRMEAFRAKYRQGCDVLLVDDIQFLAGKERTQVEFFHTFNSLHAEKKQIVLTSDRPPHEISNLEERLRSRFQWGLIADVQAPELETRMAILNAKASAENLVVDEDVVSFLAQTIKSNVRELEGCLVRLSAHARLHRLPIDIPLARLVLKDLIVAPGPTVTVGQIQKLVASYFNVTTTDLKGARRHRAIAMPRMIAMYLCRSHTPSSFPDIGRRFGNRDHSTVISAVRKIQEQIEEHEPTATRAVTDLRRSLGV
jgi:chromosomal replication initiator protein